MYSPIYDTNVPYVHCSTETFATPGCYAAACFCESSASLQYQRPAVILNVSFNMFSSNVVFLRLCRGGSVKVRVKLAHISNADWSHRPKLKRMCLLRLLVKTLTRVSSLRWLFIIPQIVKFC